jgi:hypothetical protein
MTEHIIDGNIFGRYDIYKFFLRESPVYNEYGNKVVTFDEYYELERFFADKFSCDCTDCGGHDISRSCAVERAFYSMYGMIKNEDIV